MCKHSEGSHIWSKIFGIGFFIGYVTLFVYNIVTNNTFFKASATTFITIGIAIFVSYYLVQRDNNRRKQKDVVYDFILKFQSFIEQEHMYNFDGQKSEEILMRTRDFNNRIDILESVKNKYNFSSEIDFIRNKFEEYNCFIGDNINKLDYLYNSQTALKRPLDLINSKLVVIALELYR